MPSIHVIFDPQDRMVGMKPEDLRRVGASAAVMSIDAEMIEPDAIQRVAEKLTALLLSEIVRGQE